MEVSLADADDEVAQAAHSPESCGREGDCPCWLATPAGVCVLALVRQALRDQEYGAVVIQVRRGSITGVETRLFLRLDRKVKKLSA
jgi:hypothetical protein